MNRIAEKGIGEVADQTGLAVALVDSDGQTVGVANNNSICESLQASRVHRAGCAEFCGRAFQLAQSNSAEFSYECHVGLSCVAVPLDTSARPLVAIVGRAFRSAEKYYAATSRLLSGEWNDIPEESLLANVLVSGSSLNFDRALAKVGAIEFSEGEGPESGEAIAPEDVAVSINPELSEFESDSRVWQSFLSLLFESPYLDACRTIIGFLKDHYGLKNIAWLERRNGHFETLMTAGDFRDEEIGLRIKSNDRRLFDAVRDTAALEVPIQDSRGESSVATLFPMTIGGEMRGIVAVTDRFHSPMLIKRVAKFSQTAATEIEILRLRDEVQRRGRLARAVEQFNRSLDEFDSEAFWSDILSISAELMQSERASLLVFDEPSREFTVAAAIGVDAALLRTDPFIGSRIAGRVAESEEPIVTADIAKLGLSEIAARKYKTRSFISLPFRISASRVGILNMSDRVDGSQYLRRDLELLSALVPQFSVLIDRATLISRAGEYQQLSVTDPLTGLLNRRYLKERLEEEVKRTRRSGDPMSFMMIDVDDFKSYNDTFGHTEGDKALQIVARCLKESLRGADVAVRYGGEEFSILLPSTNLEVTLTVAERIRARVESTEFPNRKVTVSIGIAGFGDEIKSADQLIDAADFALYAAKGAGRNAIRISKGERGI